MADFKKDLAFGKQAESVFLKRFPQLIQTDGMKGDFITPCGTTLEVKNDRYCPIKWQNYIMERYRSKERPGGPWQALEHGADYFAYNFTKTGLLALFDTKELIKELEIVIERDRLELQGIENGTYTTRFYRVPRSTLDHLLKPHSLLGVES